MNDSHQHFFACVLLHLLIPLAPLLIEFIYSEDITLKSFVMAGAMYSISIAVSSNQLAIFVLALVIGFLFSASYGAVEGTTSALPLWSHISPWVVLLVAITHGFERYDRHITKGEQYIILKQIRRQP